MSARTNKNKKTKANVLSRGRLIGGALLVCMAASAVGFMACSDDSSAVKEPIVTPDSGPGPGIDSSPTPGVDSSIPTDGMAPVLPDGAPTDCVLNPTNTHLDIINACTDAVRIVKNPSLPLLLADGGLPPP